MYKKNFSLFILFAFSWPAFLCAQDNPGTGPWKLDLMTLTNLIKNKAPNDTICKKVAALNTKLKSEDKENMDLMDLKACYAHALGDANSEFTSLSKKNPVDKSILNVLAPDNADTAENRFRIAREKADPAYNRTESRKIYDRLKASYPEQIDTLKALTFLSSACAPKSKNLSFSNDMRIYIHEESERLNNPKFVPATNGTNNTSPSGR